MQKFLQILSWVGIILLGLAHGVLEDLMFMEVIVEHAPPSLDLTGDIFFVFTIPIAQLMVLAVTGPLAWFFLGLRHLPKLITFWLCWTIARTAALLTFKNPVEDILIYLLWIALWCALIGLLARYLNKRQASAITADVAY